ncbi:MAG: hypothetical protein AAF841_06505 [Pseudomonadota bacterium]
MRICLILLAFSLCACARLPLIGDMSGDASPEPAAEPTVQVLDPETLDPPAPSSPAARAVGGEIANSGKTVATLGDATQSGLWLETPLVSTTGPGRITSEVTGRSVEVMLRPIDGLASAGSRISVAAMSGLGLELTSVAALTVEAVTLDAPASEDAG